MHVGVLDCKKELELCVAYHHQMADLYKKYHKQFTTEQANTEYPITKLLDHAVIGFARKKL